MNDCQFLLHVEDQIDETFNVTNKFRLSVVQTQKS